MPDRIVIFPGRRPVFVELKTDRGRLTSLQRIQCKRLKELGQDVRVVYGIDGLSQFFQDMGYEMLEKEIEKILVSEVKKLGGWAYKWTSPGNDGVPDRIVIFPGRRPVFVELKTDRGRLTSLQHVQCKRLKELGQDVRVVYGIDGLSQFFQDMGYEETSKALDCRYEL